MTKTFSELMGQKRPVPTLNPKFFNTDDSIRESVRQAITTRAIAFASKLGYTENDIEDLVLVGGNASYDYSDASDLDVTIQLDRDLNIDKKTLRLLGTVAANLNYRLSPSVDGTDLNFYISSTNVGSLRPAKQGVYSFTRGWLKPPTSQPEQHPNFIAAKSNYFLEQIEECVADERTEANDCAKKLLDRLKRYRVSGLKSREGEMSTPNLVWRTLSRSGYIQMLKQKIETLEKDFFRIQSGEAGSGILKTEEYKQFIQMDFGKQPVPQAIVKWSNKVLKGGDCRPLLNRVKPIVSLFKNTAELGVEAE